MEAPSPSLGGPARWADQAKPKIVAAMLRAPTVLPIMVPPFAFCRATQGPDELGRGRRKCESLHQFHGEDGKGFGNFTSAAKAHRLRTPSSRRWSRPPDITRGAERCRLT